MGTAVLTAVTEGQNWYQKNCHYRWGSQTDALIGVAHWCATGVKQHFPGKCIVEENESGQCAKTDHPIDILSGAKQFTFSDFSTADRALGLRRFFNSGAFTEAQIRPAHAPLGGLANWSLSTAFELQIPNTWNDLVNVLTPDGRGLTFKRDVSGAMLPYRPTSAGSTVPPARPLPQVAYRLEFVGTWPGTLSTLKNASTTWNLYGPDGTVYTLVTGQDPVFSNAYLLARPTLIVAPGGATQTLTYTSDGRLLSIADDHGKRIVFDWIVTTEPRAISVAHLPRGETLTYVYDSVTANTANEPQRLIRVEYRSSAGVLVDSTTYEHGDADFPFFVAGIKDKNGVLRWSVTYDAEGRATKSAGPSDVDAFTITYSTAGVAPFVRTVTNALGRQETYTYSGSATSTNVYDHQLTGVAGLVSTHCPASGTSVTYAADKLPEMVTDEEGRVTAYQSRDGRGRPQTVVEAYGTALARTSTITWHSVVDAPTQVMRPDLTTADSYASGSAGGGPASAYSVTQTYAYSGAAANHTVLSGVNEVTIDLWGAAGGNGNGSVGGWSGAGAYLTAIFPVTAGDVLTVDVGGGGQGAIRIANGGAGGWPDGGGGARGDNGSGGGGGSTRFYINGVLKAVAAGGGGSGGLGTSLAGAGGNMAGQNASGNGGTGATQSAGGVDVSAPTVTNKIGRSLSTYPGAQRLGGWGGSTGDSTTTTTDDGGGGGGGYWGGGGGGGNGHAGGGGSSWIATGATSAIAVEGDRQIPALTPAGQPTVATGVNSAANGPAVPGGDGYATLRLK